jgi:hypothetical protein
MGRLRGFANGWRSPAVLMFVLTVAMAVGQGTYQALINNFAVERAAFTGQDIGVLHTVREIPGLLAFTVLFFLMLVREQKLAFVTLMILGAGTAAVGYFPSAVGLWLTTLISSIGFHYFEAIRQSLVMQWIDIKRAPLVLGRITAVNSFASLATFGVIFLLLRTLHLDFVPIYVIGGAVTFIIAVWAWIAFPRYDGKERQSRKLVLRQRYSLFYALTFLSGARRIVISVFAGFLMVQKFGYDASAMTLMLLVNYGINVFLGANVGRFIMRFGERRALMIEYVGIIFVFLGYAFVDDANVAVGLYVMDNVLFAMSISIRTYFQKIADPKDMANTAGVSSTINHIAAVFLPAVLGLVWMSSPSAVFLVGAALAACSLVCIQMVPRNPAPGNEVNLLFRRRRAAATPAE